ncbi:MFS general substrate transporter [Paraphaeosphaeria sporulosa]|uniref:MFS general substrate transporter n=1 Tax=Paraphaeosphaeria sporulosa TaxID=1460663 RepID=A0A177CMG6_9PLEO|nr:MFS general substrate transporter [Paraphaeosphaeria sporulosa]OAG08725.1 MFS general substrate transporter [Paraphaeosphaeria sporulosa]
MASTRPQEVKSKGWTRPGCKHKVDVEIIPGTEIMKDAGGVHFVHAQNSAELVVLIPQPTNRPDDPLNWSPWWKFIVIFNQGFFVISSIVPALSISPLTQLLMDKWQKSLTEIALLTGVLVITGGYFNFIIIPCSEIFGRRITLLVCAALSLAACVWSATATSYGSFLGARVLTGTGSSANESIMNVVVADMFFLHERGRYIGSYFWCYFVGVLLGPILSGAVAEQVSFRWFFWACAIAQGLNLLLLMFFFPETRRLHEHKTTHTPTGIVSEGKPSRAQFGLLQSVDGAALKGIMRHFFLPVHILFFPIILWASMSMGSAANSLLGINLLQSPVLSAPPYNFNSAQVGYANFALVAGGVIGLVTAGPWSDWVSARATMRNNGVREPEMRLVSLIPFIAAALIGLVVSGVGMQDKWPWPAVVIVGFGFVGLQVVTISTITITYAIDCYKPVTGEIMVIATVCKNTFGFGMTYYMNDWATKSGYIPPVMLLLAMNVGITLLGTVVFMFFGKTFRRWTKDSKIHSQ